MFIKGQRLYTTGRNIFVAFYHLIRSHCFNLFCSIGLPVSHNLKFFLYTPVRVLSSVLCTSVTDPGFYPGSRISDPRSESRNQDPGSWIQDPTTATKEDREKFCCPTFSLWPQISQIVNYFIFELVKKKSVPSH
jgi:hypothetical protein